MTDAQLPDFTKDVHDLIFEYQEDGLGIGEMAEVLSLVAQSYKRLETTIEVMEDDEVQAALEEGDMEGAVEIALQKKESQGDNDESH